MLTIHGAVRRTCDGHIGHELQVLNAENRPTPIVEGGEPVTALWS